MSNVIIPVINLNGSSAAYLLIMHRAALDVLRSAQVSLCALAPNGRDYQTAEPGSLELACEQHFKRVADLELLIADLTEITLGIYGQTVSRKTRG